MKPHIYFWSGGWCCRFDANGIRHLGPRRRTPRTAYKALKLLVPQYARVIKKERNDDR